MKKIRKEITTHKAKGSINKENILQSQDKKINEEAPEKTTWHEMDEQRSEGSANAFERTEEVWDDE